MSASDDGKIDFRLWNIMSVFIGIVVLVLHLGVFFFNKHMFYMVVSMYAMAFVIVFIVYLQKKKDCMSAKEFNVLTYLSFFMLCIEILALVLGIMSMINLSKPANGSYPYRSY